MSIPSGTNPTPHSPDRLRLAALIALALAVVLSGCWLLYIREAEQIAQRQAEREVVRVNLLAKLMQSELRPVADDLRLLADGDGLRHFLETGEQRGLQAALRRARFFSEHKPGYDKVRYLDQGGQEILRVNHGGQVVEPSKLQNKADRHYFQRASQLPPGGLYLSAFDLSIENGQVERPYKPMLRFAVPVFDSKGQRRGVYVINYLAGRLVDRLQQMVPLYAHRLRMLNSQGYWLKGAGADLEWGFMLPAQEHSTLARSDARLWARVQREQAGQFRSADGIFTWRRLSPSEYIGVETAALHADEPFVVMASEVSPAEWGALFTGLRQIMLLVSAALVLLTLSCIWLFHRWRHAMQGLRETNEQLEGRVRERTAELAQSYELLKSHEQLLEETGDLAKVGGWELDPESGKGRWTREIARIHELGMGVQPSRQLGLEFYPGESRTRIEAALQRAISEGTPYDLELEFVSARGEHK